MADVPTARDPLVRREGVAPADDYDHENAVDDKTMHKIIMACSYSWFMWNLMYTSIVPMMPFYARDYDLSRTQQGMVLASIHFGFIAGVLMFQGGLRPQSALKIGAACYIIGPAIIAFDPGLVTLIIGRLIEGFGAAPLIITHDATLSRSLAPHQKGRAFAMKGAIGTSGLFFGPVIGQQLYEYGGLRGPMICITVMGCFGVLVYYNYLPAELFREREKVLESGSTWKERSAHFKENQLLTMMMIVQLLTFILIGIFFLLVPDFLHNHWEFSMGSLVMLWLSWDFVKVVLGLAAGGMADRGNTWIVCMCGLLLQSFMIFLVAEAANAALASKDEWKLYWFLISVGVIFGLGTTVDGFIGGPFVKLMTEVERLLGKDCYEELFAISVTVVALGEALGSIYAGYVYQYVGFGFALSGFAWCHLIGMLICAYSIQGMVRPLFDTEKRGLDSQSSA